MTPINIIRKPTSSHRGYIQSKQTSATCADTGKKRFSSDECDPLADRIATVTKSGKCIRQHYRLSICNYIGWIDKYCICQFDQHSFKGSLELKTNGLPPAHPHLNPFDKSYFLVHKSQTMIFFKPRSIPHICHRHHRRCLCKKKLPGVNLYRFNAKNWQFTV